MALNRRWTGTETHPECFASAQQRFFKWAQGRLDSGEQLGNFLWDYKKLSSCEFGVTALFPYGCDNIPSTAGLNDHLHDLEAELELKESTKTGVGGALLGRGLWTMQDLHAGKTIGTLWGKFCSRRMMEAQFGHSDRVMALSGQEWKETFLVSDPRCPMTYVNSAQGTDFTANVEFIQGSTAETLIEVRVLKGLTVPAGTELLADYGSTFFLANTEVFFMLSLLSMFVVGGGSGRIGRTVSRYSTIQS